VNAQVESGESSLPDTGTKFDKDAGMSEPPPPEDGTASRPEIATDPREDAGELGVSPV
jgi:hypothetical protein